MKTLVQKTREEIKRRGLDYTPELFDTIFNEIKSNPNNIKEEEERQSKMISNTKNTHISRFTAYGMNKRPY